MGESCELGTYQARGWEVRAMIKFSRFFFILSQVTQNLNKLYVKCEILLSLVISSPFNLNGTARSIQAQGMVDKHDVGDGKRGIFCWFSPSCRDVPGNIGNVVIFLARG